MIKFVLHFHSSPAWRLSPSAVAADSCTLCNLFQILRDDKFLCQNVGFGSSTEHGRRVHCHPFDCSLVALVDTYIAYRGTSWFLHVDPIWVMTIFFAKRCDWEVLHRHPCNLCILSLYESGKQYWVQSLPSKCSVIRAGHGPSSNICCQHDYFK